MKHCIINNADKEIIAKMEELGFVCHDVIHSDCVSEPISAHSDVLYRKLDSNTILVSSCQKENKALLEQFGYIPVFIDKMEKGYKTECKLNFIINDKYIIYNPFTAIELDTEIMENKKLIQVKQGYTGCSTICVNDNAYITDDDGIFKTLTENNIDCLKISKGNILLDGYNYGFIGGASVKINDREILFFGDIENTEDKKAVIEFLDKYNKTAIFIENKKLTDIGSALIL